MSPRSSEQPKAPSRRGHRHGFHAMWWHFGDFGRQDVHLHPCDSECDWELVGPGRECSGSARDHVRLKLSDTARDHWSNKRHEGEPL